jgi:hypothetical protein
MQSDDHLTCPFLLGELIKTYTDLFKTILFLFNSITDSLKYQVKRISQLITDIR